MIASSALRYHRATAEDSEGGSATTPALGAVPATDVPGSGASSYGAAPVGLIPVGGGYWQIGEGDEVEGGRKGQVTPFQ